MGNDKAGTYGANDFAYMFLINSPTIYESKHNATGGVSFVQGPKTGGYVMEIRIPWSTLGGAPAPGSFMGFDLHVNDDDGGGARDAKIAWQDASDNAWQWPSVLGTLQVAACNNPLPVKLLTFTGERNGSGNFLSWTTVFEVANDKFIIERSRDLSEWEVIGEVAGAGTWNSPVNYSYIDHAPYNGISYYRLRQVDMDGAISFSKVVAIKPDKYSIIIAPNPFENMLTIQSEIPEKVNIKIIDVLGRTLFYSEQEITNGKLTLQPDLVPGAYVLVIETETFTEQYTVIRH